MPRPLLVSRPLPLHSQDYVWNVCIAEWMRSFSVIIYYVAIFGGRVEYGFLLKGMRALLGGCAISGVVIGITILIT